MKKNSHPSESEATFLHDKRGDQHDGNDLDIPVTALPVDLTLDKVGGLVENLDLLRRHVFLPLRHPHIFHAHGISPTHTLMFLGPPGTGKTLLAQALVSEVQKIRGRAVTFYHRKGGDILNKFMGESERTLREVVDRAVERRPALIFLDEVDALVPHRGRGLNDVVFSNLVCQLQVCLERLHQHRDVFLIAATNRIDVIDSSLRVPGKFDLELSFPYPSPAELLNILHIYTRRWEGRFRGEVADLDTVLLDHVRGGGAGAGPVSCLSGADVKHLCVKTLQIALEQHMSAKSFTRDNLRSITSRDVFIRREHFISALRSIKPSSQRLSYSVITASPRQAESLRILANNVDSHTTLKDVLKPSVNGAPSGVTLLFSPSHFTDAASLPSLIHRFLSTRFPHARLESISLSYLWSNNKLSCLGAGVAQIFRRCSSKSAVIFIPRIDTLWNDFEELVPVLSMCLNEVRSGLTTTVVATSMQQIRHLPEELKTLFQYWYRC